MKRCTRFHKKLSRNVSSNGRTAGRSVCITKETTLKGTGVSDVKINNCVFADERTDTFCTAHVQFVQPTYNLYSPRTICTLSRSVLPRIRNVWDKICGENLTHNLYSLMFFFFWKSCLCEIMSENLVQPDRPKMTIWRMRTARCITKSKHTLG